MSENTSVHKSAALAFSLALLMWVIDIFLPSLSYTGLTFREGIGYYISFLRVTFGFILPIAGGIIAFMLLVNRGYSRQRVGLIILCVFFGIFIFAYGGTRTLLHLIIPLIIIWSVPKDYMQLDEKLIYLMAGYAIDFILQGMVGMFLPGDFAQVFGNNLVLPIWMIITAKWGVDITGGAGYRYFLLGVIVIIMLYFYTGFVGYNNAKANPDAARRGALSVLEAAWNNLMKGVNDTATTWDNIMNPKPVTGVPEKDPNPQGIYLTELDKGEIIYRPGKPVYVWATVEGKTLGKKIDVTVKCKAVSEDDEAVEYEGYIKETQLVVFSGVSRAISCRFEDLPEGAYTVIFTANFDFVAEGRKQIYLMDRERFVDDLFMLQDRGKESSRKSVLTEHGITDTDPESIVTTGPLNLGIGTDNVPWDIDKGEPMKTLFSITLTNGWESGGSIEEVSDVYFMVPDTMALDTESCDLSVEISSEYSEEDYIVYKTSYPLLEIEDKRVIYCQMDVDHGSLDPVPVTRRFLKARAEYLYKLEEEIEIDVEGYGDNSDFPTTDDEPTGIGTRKETCCRISTQNPYPAYEIVATPEDCARIEIEYEGRASTEVVELIYCTKKCCHESSPSGLSDYFWVESKDECASDSGFTRQIDRPENCGEA